MKMQATQPKRTLLTATSLVILSPWLMAGEKDIVPVQGPLKAAETSMDIPSSFHKYYGQRVNSWKDSERAIAKVDMDADMNMDGHISNTDPADGGAFEGTPPGLQVGVGEMTKTVIRVRPYRVDFDGEVVIGLEVAGINRSDRSGQFGSFDEEVSSTGRIRVWRDSGRTELLLDSANPDKRYVEFTTQYRVYPYNLPDAIPRIVYVEGVSSSKNHIGDLRLLLTCSHRKIGSSPQQFVESRKVLLKSFRTSFDHILFTVLPQAAQKEFINNNAEGVWLNVGPSTK
ncbi:hypothetical protein FEM03_18055 [Phragmitibacter flavus]|uniref:Uncharacterized protein n=1 Tax=Phragmitibacter flavus TaxID=2576071 RepID=A0A5R8KAE2_9BACT|nr:hypothetical protein [Phragmitibacter flavus]TLD69276.1 hypothetical protein FEM03_18055 [Phragmitibacter flavus]